MRIFAVYWGFLIKPWIKSWRAIPWYYRVIRVLAVFCWFVFMTSMVYAGAVYTQGLSQPGHETEEFTERYILKGRVHYLTKQQATNYEISNSIRVYSFPIGVIIFIICHIMERRFSPRSSDTGAL